MDQEPMPELTGTLPLPPKTRTITMTGRTPVKIREDLWPQLAQAKLIEYEDHTSISVSLKVRQHQDGRAVVYGVCELGKTGVEPLIARAGYLLGAHGPAPTPQEICDTIELTARDLRHAIPRAQDQLTECTAACIASMPAEDLDAAQVPMEPITPVGEVWSINPDTLEVRDENGLAVGCAELQITVVRLLDSIQRNHAQVFVKTRGGAQYWAPLEVHG